MLPLFKLDSSILLNILTCLPVFLLGQTDTTPSRGEDGEKRKAEFEQQALPHLDVLYNTAIRYTKNAADAEDLVQETFMRAYRFYHQFEKGTNIRAWLFKILRNTFINRYRKKVNEPKQVGYEEIEPYYEQLAKSNPGEMLRAVELDAFGRLISDEVMAALDELPEEFRTAVMLCDIQGMTYEEIGQIMECPTGTVRSRISQGRKMLQVSLLKYAKDQGYIK